MWTSWRQRCNIKFLAEKSTSPDAESGFRRRFRTARFKQLLARARVDNRVVFPSSFGGSMNKNSLKRAVLFLPLCLGLAAMAPHLLAKKKSGGDAPISDSSEQRRALHALNRLTFGPRPGDAQQVLALGVDKWIELQLHPEKIDDNALNARLEPF